MKRRYILLAALVVVAALLFCWRNRIPAGQTSLAPQVTAIVTPPPASNDTQMAPHGEIASVRPNNLGAKFLPSGEIDWKSEMERRQKAVEEGKNEWRTPIEFYGRVLDETNNPVVGASIDFSVNDLSSEGTTSYARTSDDNGGFSLSGVTGKMMIVRVSKDGYYSYTKSGLAFYYAGENQNFVPDMNNPVTFRLKKKGMVERLIRFDKGFDVPRDGSPLEVQLATAKAVPEGQGDIRVRCWTQDQGKKPGQHYDWKCEIIVSGGGLQQRTGDLDFEAPQDGYKPLDEINMPANSDAWTWDVTRKYFLKLANGNYARINFDMIAGGEHFFRLESFLNPAGSPNLEYDPANYVHAGQ